MIVAGEQYFLACGIQEQLMREHGVLMSTSGFGLNSDGFHRYFWLTRKSRISSETTDPGSPPPVITISRKPPRLQYRTAYTLLQYDDIPII